MVSPALKSLGVVLKLKPETRSTSLLATVSGSARAVRTSVRLWSTPADWPGPLAGAGPRVVGAAQESRSVARPTRMQNRESATFVLLCTERILVG